MNIQDKFAILTYTRLRDIIISMRKIKDKIITFIGELFPFLQEPIEVRQLYDKQSTQCVLDGINKLGMLHSLVAFFKVFLYIKAGTTFSYALLSISLMTTVSVIIFFIAFICKKLSGSVFKSDYSIQILMKSAGFLISCLFPFYGIAGDRLENDAIKVLFYFQCSSVTLLSAVMIFSDIRLHVFLFVMMESFICFLTYKTCTKSEIFDYSIVPNIMFFLVALIHEKDQRLNFLLKNKISKQKKIYKEFLNYLRIPIMIYCKNGLKRANKAARDIGITPENFSEVGNYFLSSEGYSLATLLEYMLVIPDLKINDVNLTFQKENQKRNFLVTAWIAKIFSEELTVAVTLKETTDTVLLQEQRAEDKFKNMLLFSLSHELRTPLNGVKGILTNVIKIYKEIAPIIRDQLKRARNCCEFLGNQIDDILDYVLLVTNEFVIHPNTFSIHKLFGKLKKYAIRELDSKRASISVEVRIDRNVPLEIFGDDQRLKQVCTNLINNSVKFTSQGTIELSAALAPNGKLEIGVSDTGVGISSDRLKKLFKIKTTESNEEHSELAGLGLTISQMICKKMGTELYFNSEVNKGTQVKFYIDYSKSIHFERELNSEGRHQLREKQRRINNPKINGSSNEFKLKSFSKNNTYRGIQKTYFTKQIEKLIIVVDDNDLNRFVLFRMIEKYGIRTLMAVNGLEAVDLATKELAKNPKLKMLIYMDLNMPVLDGITAGTRIFQLKAQEKPVIVAVTAFAAEKERKACIEAGFDMFLTKPIDIDNLKKTIALLN